MLTIIIASYNRENYLKQILNDLIASKGFNKIKVILVLYNNIDYLSNSFFSKVAKFNNIKIVKDKEDISGTERFIKNVKKSKTNLILYSHDDFYFCPNWDDILKKELDHIGHKMFYLSGTMMNNGQINFDCGNSIENFDEKKFLNIDQQVSIGSLLE